MGKTTGIAWCTATWNPWQGCTNADPIKWKIPERIFTCSWSDFFHEDADAWRNAAWDIIDRTRQHTYLILTKRTERIRAHLPWSTAPWPHVWLGTSIESSDYLWRVEELSKIPSTIRFVSAEPLLGPLDLTSIRWPHYVDGETIDAFGSIYEGDELIGISFEPGIHWVIVGGESGPGARPCNVAWIGSIVAQCQATDVPVFVKQLGTKPVWNHIVPGCSVREFLEPLVLRDRKGGDISEFPPDLRIREFPNAGMVSC